MGNHHTRPVVFRQSPHDFPVQVTLGGKAPAWGLSRWNGAGRESGASLRFVPPDDEGFTLRGDRQRLFYKGRRRSHRFTILGDTAFEYDCVLNREPESNIITFLMEGAEGFDFFRQPDTSPDPALAGSYAVYRKENIMERHYTTGTGKLCHIHRSKILDALGREVWGDLSVTGNRLCITIPEHWLGEAKYPVTVDPVVGSSTAGASYYFYYIYDSEYEECLESWRDEGATAAEIAEYLEDWTLIPSAYNELLLNRYTATEPVQGTCKVFFHVAAIEYGTSNVFVPVLFNESGNIPDTRISGEEYGYLGTRGGSPLGWNMVTFKVQNTIAANSNIWPGMMASGIGISFDYGGTYFDVMGTFNTASAKTNITNGQHLGGLLNRCGEYIPAYREAMGYGDNDWIEELRPSVSYRNHNAHPKGPGRYDLKFSCYFQPDSTAYTRTLTAGVKLTDTRKPAGTYRRTAVQTVKGTTVLNRAPVFIRKAAEQLEVMMGISNKRTLNRTMPDKAGVQSNATRKWDSKRTVVQAVTGTTALKRAPVFMRKVVEQLKAAMGISNRRTINRTMPDQTAVQGGMSRKWDSRRTVVQTVTGTTALKRTQALIRKTAEQLKAVMGISDKRTLNRTMPSQAGVQSGMTRKWDSRRTVTQTVMGTTALKRTQVFTRKAAEQLKAVMGINNRRTLNRTMPDQTAVQGGITRKWDSKRVIGNTATPKTALNRYAGTNRKLVTMGSTYTGLSLFLTFPRRIVETVRSAGGLRLFTGILRLITVQAGNSGTAKPVTGFKRDVASPVKVSTATARHPLFLRTLLNAVKAGEYSAYSVVWLRRLPERGTATDMNRHTGGYIRGLYTAAGSVAGTGHTAEYHRKQTDTVTGQGVSLRYLFIFIRLLTTGLVRDYVLRRFLKSNEEIVLKSPVCREIEIESRIH